MVIKTIEFLYRLLKKAIFKVSDKFLIISQTDYNWKYCFF